VGCRCRFRYAIVVIAAVGDVANLHLMAGRGRVCALPTCLISVGLTAVNSLSAQNYHMDKLLVQIFAHIMHAKPEDNTAELIEPLFVRVRTHLYSQVRSPECMP
jgi:hypothetical protein